MTTNLSVECTISSRRDLKALCLLILLINQDATAAIYWLPEALPVAFSTPEASCDYEYREIFPHLLDRYRPDWSHYRPGALPQVFECGYLNLNGPTTPSTFGAAYYVDSNCSDGKMFDLSIAKCGYTVQKGRPDDSLSCAPTASQGNPINSATGNKFQEELDFSIGSIDPIKFIRYYNSVDMMWRHSYSTRLEINEEGVRLISADGRESFFSAANGLFRSSTDMGALSKVGEEWVYQSPANERLMFSFSGRLLSRQSKDGYTTTLAYDASSIKITNARGLSAELVEDGSHQPLSVISGETSASYTYSGRHVYGGTLIKADIFTGGKLSTRSYLYEDSRFPTLLTGIIDGRGVRFATWAYDANQRAVLSEHALGAGRTTLEYKSDLLTTVTNSLGLQTNYRFQMINGFKHIIAIEGEPTADCAASNSSYEYDASGRVRTKTDARGMITTYTYNDRGLEVSHTEASGTPLARTIITEWDAVRFIKLRVVEPERVTTFKYDQDGRELSRSITRVNGL